MISDFEVGWMAGLIDGEGAIVLVQNRGRVRKSDGRYSIGNRLMVSVVDFSILEKFTRLLSKLDVEYCYVRQEYNSELHKTKVNVTVHKQQSLLKLLPIITPHLSLKQEQSIFLMNFIQWRIDNRSRLHYQGYGTFDPTIYDEEYKWWDEYCQKFQGRGKSKSHARDLIGATLLKSTPIRWSD